MAAQIEETQLKLEPMLPRLNLSNFRGGNQLPVRDIGKKDFQIPKKMTILTHLSKEWNESSAKDIQIVLGDKRIRCNRLCLMCYSKYFRERVKGGERELVVPNDTVTPSGLVSACEWMHRPTMRLQRHNIMDVLSTASYLEIDPLIKHVWFCLDMVNEFSEDQAFLVSYEASRFGKNLPVPGLDTTMLSRIHCFFLTLVASIEFLQLSVRHICFLLNSENLAVNSEREVFYSAVRWLTYEWPSRAQHIGEVLSCVRMVLLNRKFLIQLQRPTGDPEIDSLIAHADFQYALYDAFSCQTVLIFNDGSNICGQLFDTFQIDKPLRRPFIYHSLCVYHKLQPDESSYTFSYQQFLAYLRVLQTAGVYNWKDLRAVHALTPFDPNEYFKNI